MSRIGNLPIKIEDNVTVTTDNTVVKVKGSKGELLQEIGKDFFVKILETSNGKELIVTTENLEKDKIIKQQIKEISLDKTKEEKLKIKEIKNLNNKLSKPDKEIKSKHGLYRALINNMVQGVSKGYEKKLELVGVGYKSSVQSNLLELSLGYSHTIFFKIPDEIKVSSESLKGKNPIITLESVDKQLIGQVAAKIKSLRKVEPYKGKGIRFVGEIIRRKAGKTAASK